MSAFIPSFLPLSFLPSAAFPAGCGGRDSADGTVAASPAAVLRWRLRAAVRGGCVSAVSWSYLRRARCVRIVQLYCAARVACARM